MSGPDKKLLISVFVVWAVLLLLFANGVSAEPFIKDDGETVTMDKGSFNKMLDTIAAQQKLLNRSNSLYKIMEQRYDDAEVCVREAVKNNAAVTPCFNVDPTMAFTPKEHQRFLNNTVEH